MCLVLRFIEIFCQCLCLKNTYSYCSSSEFLFLYLLESIQTCTFHKFVAVALTVFTSSFQILLSYVNTKLSALLVPLVELNWKWSLSIARSCASVVCSQGM